MSLRKHYESKIMRELERANSVLDELEVVAHVRRAYAAVVTIHAARDLALYIEKLRGAASSASGFLAWLKVSCDLESARRQLNRWIERLVVTLRGSAALSS